MRFAVAAALFAGAVMAHDDVASSTLYTTKYYTITACPSTVTDCPAKTTSTVIPLTTSTVYTTKVYTVTDCPKSVTDCPNKGHTSVVTYTEAVSTTICPVETVSTKYHNYTVPAKPHTYPPKDHEHHTKEAHPSKAPECPTYSVKTISTSYTTVVPTVIYETVSIPCPTPTKSYGGNKT
jgi:hypothetical protein